MLNLSILQRHLILLVLFALCMQSCDSGTEPKPDPLTITFILVNASYMEAKDGSIDLTVTGGTAPYGFLWSTGATTEDILDLAAGTYTVIVTDAEQGQITDSVKITEPDNIGRVTDIDGNVYKTVKIGTQWWMAENLKVTRDPQGNPINSFLYNDDPDNESTLGRLYTWDVAMDSSTYAGARGIAPSGWHIPTFVEWDKLIGFLGGKDVAGGPMKQTGFTNWASPNTGASNSSGFAALGAGEKEGNRYQFLKTIAIFWSSNKVAEYAYYYYLSHDNTEVVRRTWQRDLAYSVRCIKNN